MLRGNSERAGLLLNNIVTGSAHLEIRSEKTVFHCLFPLHLGKQGSMYILVKKQECNEIPELYYQTFLLMETTQQSFEY